MLIKKLSFTRLCKNKYLEIIMEKHNCQGLFPVKVMTKTNRSVEYWQEKLMSKSLKHRKVLQLTHNVISKQCISHEDCQLINMVSGSLCLLTLQNLSKLYILHIAGVFISPKAGTPKGSEGKYNFHSCSSFGLPFYHSAKCKISARLWCQNWNSLNSYTCQYKNRIFI